MSEIAQVSCAPGQGWRIRPILAIAFAFLLAATIVCCRAPADGSAVHPAPLRVGTSGDYRPFSYSDPSGSNESSPSSPSSESFRPRGFSIDLAEAWAADTGRTIAWVPFRWTTLADDLTQQRFDLALSGVTVRPDRSIRGRFSLPLTVSGAVVLVPAKARIEGEAGGLADEEALRRPGLTLAVNAGGHLERTARALFPHATVRPVPANADVLAQLDRPGVDAVVTDDLEAPHWLARRPDLRAIGPLTRDRKAAWFPIDRDALRLGFDRWLIEAEQSGSLARLRARHGLPPARTATPDAALLASLDERLSPMSEVARLKQVLGRPVEDRPREARVLAAALAAVAREARARGVAPPAVDATRALYRAQIEAAKEIQRRWMGAQPPPEESPSEAARAQARTRLESEVRPALIALGDRIAGLLVLAGASPAAKPSVEDVRVALSRHALPEDRIAALSRALIASLESARP